jgi:hypothetical protein
VSAERVAIEELADIVRRARAAFGKVDGELAQMGVSLRILLDPLEAGALPLPADARARVRDVLVSTREGMTTFDRSLHQLIGELTAAVACLDDAGAR